MAIQWQEKGAELVQQAFGDDVVAVQRKEDNFCPLTLIFFTIGDPSGCGEPGELHEIKGKPGE